MQPSSTYRGDVLAGNNEKINGSASAHTRWKRLIDLRIYSSE